MDLAYLVQVSRTPYLLRLGFLAHPWLALIPENRIPLVIAIFDSIKQRAVNLSWIIVLRNCEILPVTYMDIILSRLGHIST